MKSFLSRVSSSLLNICVYSYLATVLIVLLIIWFSGDRWWFGTILLYGPRWIYALPLIFLVPISLIMKRRCLWPLGLSALLVAWPIMGLNVSLGGLLNTNSPELRVLTYNVNRWDVMGEEFAILLDEIQPDFAAVQECAAPKRFRRSIPDKWFSFSSGYSIVVSRHPISHCEIFKRGLEVNGLYCVVETPLGPVGFGNVDLLTPRRALTTILDREKIFDLSQVDYAQQRIAQRWHESEQLSNWLQSFPESNKIFAGDFNLTDDSPIFRSFWATYQNAYGTTMSGYGHTKKTKINIFRYQSRIDHILSSTSLQALKSWVGPDLGSDHLPLIADFIRN